MKKVIDGKVVQAVDCRHNSCAQVINDLKEILSHNACNGSDTLTLSICRKGNLVTIDHIETTASGFADDDLTCVKKHIEIATNGLASSSAFMDSVVEALYTVAHISHCPNSDADTDFVEIGNPEGTGLIIDLNGNLDPNIGLTDTVTYTYGERE